MSDNRGLKYSGDGLLDANLVDGTTAISPIQAADLDAYLSGPYSLVGNKEVGRSRLDKQIDAKNQLEDLPDFRGNVQSGFAQIAAGTAKFGTTAVTTALGSLGLIEGLARVIAGEDFDKLWNNHTSNFFNDLNRKAEDWFRNEYTNEEQEAAWYKKLFTPNTIGDVFIKNLGFVAGMAIPGGAAANGISAGLKAMGAGAKWGKALTMITSSVIGAATEAQMESLNAVKDFQDMQLNGGEINTALAEANLQARKEIDSYVKTLDKEYMDADLRNPELLNQLNAEKQAKIEQFVRQKSMEVDYFKEELMGKLKETSASLGNKTWAANMAILTASNLLGGFRGIFQGPYNNVQAGVKTAAKKQLARGAAKSIAQGMATKLPTAAAEGLLEEVPEHIGRKMFWETLRSAIIEGTEEGTQALSSTTAQMWGAEEIVNYINARKDPESTLKVASLQDAFSKALKEQFGTIESPGWGEVYFGAVTGTTGAFVYKNRSKGAQAKERLARMQEGMETEYHTGLDKFLDKYHIPVELSGGIYGAYKEAKETSLINEQIRELNKALKADDPNSPFIQRLEALVADFSAEKVKKTAIHEDDESLYTIGSVAQVSNMIFLFEKMGLLPEYLEMISGITENMSIEDVETIMGADYVKNKNSEEVRNALKDRATYVQRLSKQLVEDKNSYMNQMFRSKAVKEKYKTAPDAILKDLDQLATQFALNNTIIDELTGLRKTQLGEISSIIRNGLSSLEGVDSDALSNISDAELSNLFFGEVPKDVKSHSTLIYDKLAKKAEISADDWKAKNDRKMSAMMRSERMSTLVKQANAVNDRRASFMFKNMELQQDSFTMLLSNTTAEELKQKKQLYETQKQTFIKKIKAAKSVEEVQSILENEVDIDEKDRNIILQLSTEAEVGKFAKQLVGLNNQLVNYDAFYDEVLKDLGKSIRPDDAGVDDFLAALRNTKTNPVEREKVIGEFRDKIEQEKTENSKKSKESEKTHVYDLLDLIFQKYDKATRKTVQTTPTSSSTAPTPASTSSTIGTVAELEAEKQHLLEAVNLAKEHGKDDLKEQALKNLEDLEKDLEKAKLLEGLNLEPASTPVSPPPKFAAEDKQALAQNVKNKQAEVKKIKAEIKAKEEAEAKKAASNSADAMSYTPEDPSLYEKLAAAEAELAAARAALDDKVNEISEEEYREREEYEANNMSIEAKAAAKSAEEEHFILTDLIEDSFNLIPERELKRGITEAYIGEEEDKNRRFHSYRAFLEAKLSDDNLSREERLRYEISLAKLNFLSTAKAHAFISTELAKIEDLETRLYLISNNELDKQIEPLYEEWILYKKLDLVERKLKVEQKNKKLIKNEGGPDSEIELENINNKITNLEAEKAELESNISNKTFLEKVEEAKHYGKRYVASYTTPIMALDVTDLKDYKSLPGVIRIGDKYFQPLSIFNANPETFGELRTIASDLKWESRKSTQNGYVKLNVLPESKGGIKINRGFLPSAKRSKNSESEEEVQTHSVAKVLELNPDSEIGITVIDKEGEFINIITGKVKEIKGIENNPANSFVLVRISNGKYFPRIITPIEGNYNSPHLDLLLARLLDELFNNNIFKQKDSEGASSRIKMRNTLHWLLGTREKPFQSLFSAPGKTDFIIGNEYIEIYELEKDGKPIIEVVFKDRDTNKVIFRGKSTQDVLNHLGEIDNAYSLTLTINRELLQGFSDFLSVEEYKNLIATIYEVDMQPASDINGGSVFRDVNSGIEVVLSPEGLIAQEVDTKKKTPSASKTLKSDVVTDEKILDAKSPVYYIMAGSLTRTGGKPLSLHSSIDRKAIIDFMEDPDVPWTETSKEKFKIRNVVIGGESVEVMAIKIDNEITLSTDKVKINNFRKGVNEGKETLESIPIISKSKTEKKSVKKGSKPKSKPDSKVTPEIKPKVEKRDSIVGLYDDLEYTLEENKNNTITSEEDENINNCKL